MASTSSEAGMKKESSASGEGTEEAPARARSESLYFGGMKKARRERLLGCTTAKERISKMPPCVAGKRSSIYRGVTRHRWTGRYEAHLWDKSTWNQNQNKKGKQVYLGAYDDEEAAARAYDLAALKYWGPGTLINFPVSDYSRDLEEMQVVSKEDYLVSLRRKSSAFSRGSPKCRGVTRFPQSGQLEASLGQVLGSDYCTSLNCSMAMDPSMEKKYVNNICMDRKIDLTSYIRWWGPNRKHQSDSFGKFVDENPTTSEEASKELHALDYQQQPTEPYQLPVLGPPRNVKSNAPSVSAYAILSQSAAFKNFKQRLSESSNDSCSKELSYERSAPVMSTGSEIERTCASLGFHDLPTQIAAPTRMPLVSMPSKTNWSSVDTNTDVIFWTNQALSSGLPTAPTLKKFETSSPYP